MPRYRRGKSMSSRARRSRTLKAIGRKADTVQISQTSPVTIPTASKSPVRRKKQKVPEINYEANGEQFNGTVGRTVLSTACVLQIANLGAQHNKICSGYFRSLKILNGSVELECSSCDVSMIVSADHGKFLHAKLITKLFDHCNYVPTSILTGINHCSYEKALTLSVFTSGTGLEALNTTLSTLLVPELSFFKFQRQEQVLFVEMYAALQQEFEYNINKEFRLAMEAGDFVVVDGKRIPFITVVVDGGWNKRSFGHRYDSKAGVAVIIGARTKKILFMDWRIKNCAKCSYDERNGISEAHQCFANWTDSAQAMEADIIVEGFKLSYQKHNILYRYMVGDADSSVYFKVKSTVHYPGGVEIEKIDCVNHALRCLTSKLHGIAKNTAFLKNERDAIGSKIPQLARDAKGAINHNYDIMLNDSSSSSPAPAKLLYDDLVNIPRHVFGDHSNCKDYFCKTRGEKKPEPIVNSRIYAMVRNAFSQTAQRSDRLVYNVTSNLAEGFMAQVCKFTSGKRCNQTQRYGYPLRVMASMFAYDHGSFWPAEVYKKYYDKFSPIWDEKHAKSIAIRKRHRTKQVTRFLEPKRRKSSSGDYGENSVDSDVDPKFMEASISSLVGTLQVTMEDRDRIQMCTIGQAYNPEWKFQRRHRITASVCGKIFRMRDSTNSSKCIQSILYPVDLTMNENVRRGIDLEPVARQRYEEEFGEYVTDCGLFVSLENGILAASPDGLIADDGILEIKCTSVTPKELCSRNDKILVKDLLDPEIFHLNKKHVYYSQVIMQLYVSGRKWCDFVIYFAGESASEDVIWKERIFRTKETDQTWNEMKEKIVKFFKHDIAPEVVEPRYPKGLPIRQPSYRIDAAEVIKSRKQKAAENREQRKAQSVATPELTLDSFSTIDLS